MLHQGHTILSVHRLTAAARSSIQRWLSWYQECGISGLESKQCGRFCSLPYHQISLILEMLIQFSPEDFGYQRSRWSSELFASLIHRICPELNIAASTLLRWLPRIGIVWRRAAPTLHVRDPHRDEKIALINNALQKHSVDEPTSILIRRLVLTGCDVMNKNGSQRQGKMKNIMLPEHSIVRQEKWFIPQEPVKTLGYSFSSWKR